MTKCLLCQENNEKRQLFSDVFLIRKRSSSICQDCQSQFLAIAEQRCRNCCKKCLETICQDCQYWQSQGKTVEHHALYQYNDKMMEYFSQYKFRGDYCLRKVFAEDVKLYLSQMKEYIIVPIPISQERYDERGFNQVNGILDQAGITYKNLLQKHHSQKQSEKSKAERLKTQQIFYFNGKIQLPEKIFLVDDIYTTGATLQLAKALLMKNGAKTIKTFSIAR